MDVNHGVDDALNLASLMFLLVIPQRFGVRNGKMIFIKTEV